MVSNEDARFVENQDNETLQPWRGNGFVIGCVDEVNGKGASHCPSYPTTRAELSELARCYWEVIIGHHLFIYCTGQVGSCARRRFHYARDRIDRIAKILGDEAPREAEAKAFDLFCHRYGREICEAWKRGDREFERKLQEAANGPVEEDPRKGMGRDRP